MNRVLTMLIAGAFAASLGACNKAEDPAETQADVAEAQSEASQDVAEAQQEGAEAVAEEKQELEETKRDAATDGDASTSPVPVDPAPATP